jgi:uncharacterized membrane protein
MSLIFCKDNKFFLDMLRFRAILHYTVATPHSQNDFFSGCVSNLKFFFANFHLFSLVQVCLESLSWSWSCGAAPFCLNSVKGFALLEPSLNTTPTQENSKQKPLKTTNKTL